MPLTSVLRYYSFHHIYASPSLLSFSPFRQSSRGPSDRIKRWQDIIIFRRVWEKTGSGREQPLTLVLRESSETFIQSLSLSVCERPNPCPLHRKHLEQKKLKLSITRCPKPLKARLSRLHKRHSDTFRCFTLHRERKNSCSTSFFFSFSQLLMVGRWKPRHQTLHIFDTRNVNVKTPEPLPFFLCFFLFLSNLW